MLRRYGSLLVLMGLWLIPGWLFAQQPGDATSDGVVDVLDVAAIVNQILGQGPAPGFADCDVDGTVDAADVDCVLAIILSQNSPPPSIESLSPSSTDVGSPELLLSIHGADFIDGATVRFDGSELPTTFASPVELTATVPAEFLDEAGSFPVQVEHPDGKTSAAALFNVSTRPRLDVLVPSGVAVGSPDFTLTLSGAGFRADSVAVFDRVDLSTTYVGSGMLTAVVPAALVATPGPALVLVSHPEAGDTQSSPFTVATLLLTSLSPTSGPSGTPVTLTGSGLDLPVTVMFAKQGGGTLPAPITASSPTSLTVQVPAGAATGSVSLVSGGLRLPGPVFTVTTSQTYDLEGGPATAVLLPGESATYAITASSADGFAGLIALTVSGLPAGVTAGLVPPQITPGQTSTLTLAAPPGQPTGVTAFTVTGSAAIEGQAVERTVGLSVNVQAMSTTFMGRATSADPVPIPLQGATVRFLGLDDSGNPTGCSVPDVQTDFAGNYFFTNLPLECTGVQLVGYDGLTVTSPPGQQFAGVNLRWLILPNEVTVASSLTHLIRIDTAETIELVQNAPETQFFTLETIPGLRIEVYPGTTFSLVTGEMPDPFELIAVRVPTDRLPDQKEMGPGEVMPFFVAFQPAGAFASQPVAVDYPNVTFLPAGTPTSLFTLDPTQGMMVPYGTGTVSADGLSIVADENPATPGRRYGITHFDWHGPLTPVTNESRATTGGESGAALNGVCLVGGGCTCARQGSVEYATGTEVLGITDATISGIVLPVAFARIYRSDFNDFQGPFGIDTSHSFNYVVLAGSNPTETVIELSLPNGRRLPFALQPGGVYKSLRIPFVRGSGLSWDGAAGHYRLETIDGSVMIFTPANAGATRSALTAIEDRHANRVELVRGLGSGNVEVLHRIIATNGEEITLQYDAQNRIRKLTDPGGRDTLYAYDTNGRLETVTDPAGGETVYGYDPVGLLATVTDARGILIVTKEYGADGRVIRETFPDGGEVTYAYTLANPDDSESPVIETLVTDARGNPTTYRFTIDGALTDVTDALGQTLSFTIDPVTGRYLSRTGTAGCRLCGNTGIGDQAFEYDELGRVTKITDALQASTMFTYPEVGEVPETVLDALLRLTVFNQNELGEVTSIVDPAEKVWGFTYDSFGRLETMTDPNENTTTFGYGPEGRLESVTDPLVRVTRFEYDGAGRLAATIFADNTTERLAYDSLDRFVRVEDSLGQLIRFSYDEVGNLRTVTDHRLNTTEYVYEELPQKKIAEIAPDGSQRIYLYDVNSNLTLLTDRNGQTATFEHDVLNRPLVASYEAGSLVEFDWDAAGRLVAADDYVGGRVERTYDELGRLVSEISPTGSLTFEYDALRRRTFRFGPDGTTLYTYTAQGQLESVANGSMNVQFEYDDGGRLTTAAAPNDVFASYMYDDADQLSQIDYTGPGGYSDYRSYIYDSVGQISQVSGETLAVPPASPQNSVFDNSNRIISFNGDSFQYDNEGHLLSGDGLTNVWGDQGRLLTVSDRQGVTTYAYDAFGRRQSKTEHGAVTSYLYDGLGLSSAYLDGETKDYLHGFSLDEIWAVREADATEAFVRDHRGNTIALVGETGISQVISYDEYGTPHTSGASDPRLYFGGREHDANKLIYLRARYLHPKTGRFLSEDPIGFSGGDINLFRFTGNNPVSYKDPLGLRSATLELGIDILTLLLSPGPALLVEALRFGVNAATEGCPNVSDVASLGLAGVSAGVEKGIRQGSLSPGLGKFSTAAGGIAFLSGLPERLREVRTELQHIKASAGERLRTYGDNTFGRAGIMKFRDGHLIIDKDRLLRGGNPFLHDR